MRDVNRIAQIRLIGVAIVKGDAEHVASVTGRAPAKPSATGTGRGLIGKAGLIAKLGDVGGVGRPSNVGVAVVKYFEIDSDIGVGGVTAAKPFVTVAELAAGYAGLALLIVSGSARDENRIGGAFHVRIAIVKNRTDDRFLRRRRGEAGRRRERCGGTVGNRR